MAEIILVRAKLCKYELVSRIQEILIKRQNSSKKYIRIEIKTNQLAYYFFPFVQFGVEDLRTDHLQRNITKMRVKAQPHVIRIIVYFAEKDPLSV